MIFNYIISERDGKATLIVNNKSVVFIIPNFAIKEDILQQAVLQQEELPVTSFAEVSLLPSSLGRATFQGEKQHLLTLKKIHVRDTTGKMQVSLVVERHHKASINP